MAFSRKSKERLKVSFPDGKVICMRHPKDTMIAVLKEIGSDRFGEITLERNRRPLLAKEIFPELKNYMREVTDGWYLNCQSDTDEKFLQLSLINKALGLGLVIEKGDFAEIDMPEAEKKSKKSKSRLRVVLEDGTVIEDNTAANVVMELIRRVWECIRWQPAISSGLGKTLSPAPTPTADGSRLAICDGSYFPIILKTRLNSSRLSLPI